jgi:glyoxylase-like metal-dependent hydrolase (beta-lactamase superfamily II)
MIQGIWLSAIRFLLLTAHRSLLTTPFPSAIVIVSRRSPALSNDFTPGRPSIIGPGIVRIVAPNPGPLTGPGTNTYLVGTQELAVIDPGPDDPAHVEAIAAAGAGRIAWILVTHTHADHSPAARSLRQVTGALVVGQRAPQASHQDRLFRPDAQPVDGERVVLADAALRCIATPGHASNHLCFLLEQGGVLFTGDQILGQVSPVILPPDGDMADYLDSLRRLRELPLAVIAPGHGPMLQRPVEVIDALIRHRLEREAKICEALRLAGSAALEELLAVVYADVDASLHELAIHSLLAHLLKLERDGRAGRQDALWRAVE